MKIFLIEVVVRESGTNAVIRSQSNPGDFICCSSLSELIAELETNCKIEDYES